MDSELEHAQVAHGVVPPFVDLPLVLQCEVEQNDAVNGNQYLRVCVASRAVAMGVMSAAQVQEQVYSAGTIASCSDDALGVNPTTGCSVCPCNWRHSVDAFRRLYCQRLAP